MDRSGKTVMPCVLPYYTHESPRVNVKCQWNNQTVFCPENYECTTLLNKDNLVVCENSLVYCEDINFCFEKISELMNNNHQPESSIRMSISFSNNSMLEGIIIMSSAGFLQFLFTAIVWFKFSNTKTQTMRSRHIFALIASINIIILGLLIAPGVIVFEGLQPTFFSFSDINNAHCYNPSSWFEDLLQVLLGLLSALCFSILCEVIVFVSTLSYAIPQVYSGFWNSKSFVQIAVWVVVCGGALFLIVLSTSKETKAWR
eukprot:TRINITY_DN4506_c0_g2_i2.p1 TRINITY_DN4506_c0_g2~~TRINITY_DN4506_c0_g2_i2.p1  ORF type:complete len:258 (-),score=23.79 TRINITY_DN4506_c0_g2_i2:130-903(-)